MTATQTKPSPLLEQAMQYGMSEEEYNKVLTILGREPNITELGIFSVMWSEHCSYKTTRKHLGTLPTEAPHVICGPGENAGIIDIGDNQAIIFKMESHNHPSYIEPYQGAATGVGGILRDVFTMGARPIALMNALRFGSPEHHKTRHLVNGVVEGIAGYGNCVGVPTVGGETQFHSSYDGNILVNAMAVGLARADNIFYSAAAGIGNPVVYVGSKTGRDGIHGATMASAEFDDDSAENRPTVQVGDPFTEKLLIEACLELMEEDAIIAIQDMGAAGLTSSSLEMADKGGCGIELELDKVPMREEGMTPYDLMLSESQERMLMVLKPEKQHIAERIFNKWELNIATIGTLTDTGRLVLKWHGDVAADIPVAPLADEAPIYDRPHIPTPAKPAIMETEDASLEASLKTLMACPEIASKSWIYQQYDHMVMNDTFARPGGDAAIVRIHGTEKGVAITTDCTPRYCYADPIEGGKQAVAETWRNLVSVGAKPMAITNCLNFGNPERPEIMGQLVGGIDGIRQACLRLDYPVVSGNVSLYNETNGTGIHPTPAIGGVGLIKELDTAIASHVESNDLTLFLVGKTEGHLGASLYLREIEGREEGAPPPVDLDAEYDNGSFVSKMISERRVSACHDLSDGGLLVSLTEMCFKNGIGMNVALPEGKNTIAFAYGEDQARYVLAVAPEHTQAIREAATATEIILTELGTTGGDELNIEGQFSTKIAELRELNESWLPDYMAG
ncbi:MAG: phosphoribosylformylglycinamidine synthase subunit PurL [Rickettsiales bacterium]|nr:phosphoribosylformylglycinamidine synthase subunit PurL [Rickettsiales bacterium]